MAMCVKQSNEYENCTKDGLKYALLHSFSQQRASLLYYLPFLSNVLYVKRNAVIISAAASPASVCEVPNQLIPIDITRGIEEHPLTLPDLFPVRSCSCSLLDKLEKKNKKLFVIVNFSVEKLS